MLKTTLLLFLCLFHLSIHASSCPCMPSKGQDIDTVSLWNEISSIKLEKEQIENINKYVNNPLGWSALNYSIQEKDYESALILADYSIDINKKDGAFITNLHSLSKSNALERLLFQARIPGKQRSLTPIQIQLAHKLIDKGIDFDDQISIGLGCPLVYCCYFGTEELINKLLDNGADINSSNGRPLSFAICCGHTNVVHNLINRGANINLMNMLHDAILSQKCELVELALNFGFDICKIDSIGIAINYTWSEIRDLDENLCAPLPALEMVQFLLDHGANPNFWIFEWVDKKEDIHNALRYSPLGKALHLLDHPPTCHQNLYQQTLIKMLLDYGAVMP